jgi:hypothetical protein
MMIICSCLKKGISKGCVGSETILDRKCSDTNDKIRVRNYQEHEYWKVTKWGNW